MNTRSGILILLIAFVAAGCGGGRSGERSIIENKGSDTLVNVAQAWAEELEAQFAGDEAERAEETETDKSG